MRARFCIGTLSMLLASCGEPTPPSNPELFLGTTDDGGRVTLDETSIRHSGDRVIVTERIFAPEGSPAFAGIAIQEYVLSFDCKSREYDTLDETWKYASGNILRIGKKKGEPVIPNSPIERVMNRVC